MSVIGDELVMIETGLKYLNILTLQYIYDLQQLQKDKIILIHINTFENQFMNIA